MSITSLHAVDDTGHIFNLLVSSGVAVPVTKFQYSYIYKSFDSLFVYWYISPLISFSVCIFSIDI